MRRVQSMIWKKPDEIGKEIFGMQLNDTVKLAQEISKEMRIIFKDKIDATQIYDVNDDINHRAFKIKFIAYDYFVVIFNYEQDIIGCSIEQGNSTHILLSKGKNCYSDKNIYEFFRKVDNELKLRIPDKFLEAHGWM